MTHTVIAIFDEYGQAQSAMHALFNEGFTHSDVKLSPAQDSPEARQAALQGTQQSQAESSSGSTIGNFFRSLFGSDQHANDADLYSEAMRRGSYLVTVDAASDEQGDRAAEIMQRFNPVDIDQRASQWRSSGWTGYQSSSPILTETEIQNDRSGYSKTTVATTGTTATPAASAEAGATIPVVEEQLKVGKRAVVKGGVRIYQHITETPVEESVRLSEEHVTVTRTPVNEPATEADLAAFKEGTMEVRETAEEPVVEKTARVVEEVRVGKEVTEHTETVSDTLRRTDVEVEKLSPQQAGAQTSAQSSPSQMLDEDIFRQHFQTAYGSGNYEEYAPAYHYGATLAGNTRYQGYRWDELEPQVKSEWESTHAGSPWERTKQAVRYGWEKMSRH